MDDGGVNEMHLGNGNGKTADNIQFNANLIDICRRCSVFTCPSLACNRAAVSSLFKCSDFIP